MVSSSKNDVFNAECVDADVSDVKVIGAAAVDVKVAGVEIEDGLTVVVDGVVNLDPKLVIANDGASFAVAIVIVEIASVGLFLEVKLDVDVFNVEIAAVLFGKDNVDGKLFGKEAVVMDGVVNVANVVNFDPKLDIAKEGALFAVAIVIVEIVSVGFVLEVRLDVDMLDIFNVDIVDVLFGKDIVDVKLLDKESVDKEWVLGIVFGVEINDLE